MDDVLKHYGVKGMKWGVRRTSGEIHQERTNRQIKKAGNLVNVGRNSSNAFREASNIADTVSRSSRPSKKVRNEISRMSDQELRTKINRMQMEQQYANLNPSRISRGASHAADVLSVAGSVAAIGASAAAIALAIKQYKG